MTYFKDRETAANELLKKLCKYRDQNPIVAGIPRGAMPMAKIIADGLGAELGAILTRKIPHPDNEEFAIGSIGISGNIHLLSHVNEFYQIPESYIEAEAKRQLDVLKRRQSQYGLNAVDMRGRTVIIVDDGIATGATVIGGIAEAKALGAKTIVVATPVSSVSAAKRITPMGDEYVSLYTPEGFYAVAQFYLNFPQVSDSEVIGMLHASQSAQT